MKSESPTLKDYNDDTDLTRETFVKWYVKTVGEPRLTSIPAAALLSNGYKCKKYANVHKGRSLYVYYNANATEFNGWWHKHVTRGDLRKGVMCGDVVIAYGYDNVDENLQSIAASLNFCAN